MLRPYSKFVTQLAAVACMALAPVPYAFAESGEQTLDQSAPAEILVDQKAGFATDKVEFHQISYTGENPGQAIFPRTVNARFTSKTALTGVGRKVIIRNVSPKIDNDPYPFVETKYRKGRYSEDFKIELGLRHRRGKLAVIPGENLLEYEVWQDKQLVQRQTLRMNVVVADGGTFARHLPQPQYIAPYPYGLDRACWDLYSCRQASPYTLNRHHYRPHTHRRLAPQASPPPRQNLKPAQPALQPNSLLELIQGKRQSIPTAQPRLTTPPRPQPTPRELPPALRELFKIKQ
ncbi:MAG: hypothetical protein HC934_11365 [Acaryochloridaceae cyanobacterium SU_2_1]|nr:hypothetical protein [Acaryochloridaceae cyanobacterium SU_2_1]NJM95191.1 hypothetical protein [Acaryochloridaceae cyanobacterium CSU_5_19]